MKIAVTLPLRSLIFFLTLLVLMARPAQADAHDPLTFEVYPSSAPYLFYEELLFEFIVKNHSDSSIYIRWPDVNSASITFALFRPDGSKIPHPMLEAHYSPHRPDSVEPGDSCVGYSNLSSHGFSPFFDTDAELGYLDPGEYKIVFSWCYDPYRRSTIGGDYQLHDTVEIQVQLPMGRDSIALEMLLHARQTRKVDKETASEAGRKDVKEAYLDDCELLAEKYLDTPYGRMAMQDLTRDLTRVRSSTKPGGDRLIAASLRFVSEFPNHPHSSYLVRVLTDNGADEKMRPFLEEIKVTVPNGRAGLLARKLLEEAETK